MLRLPCCPGKGNGERIKDENIGFAFHGRFLPLYPSPSVSRELLCGKTVGKKAKHQREGLLMNLTALLTDNITEILIKIVEFTRRRQKVIIRNIINVQNPAFVPEELEVNEFSSLLDSAVDEHVQNQRLVLRDTENIKFGEGGNLEVRAIVDKESKRLLEKDHDEYLERQMNKLWENSLNQKVAAELLRQKQGVFAFD